MEAIPPLFNKAMSYLTEARDAYLANDYAAYLRIIEELSRKVARLNYRIEMEITRGKHDDRKYELTTADIQGLQNFNDQLAMLEKKIIKEVKTLKESGRRWLDSPDEDFVTCFRVEIEIEYFIGEDDPSYNNEIDNCIARSKRVGDDIIDYEDQDWNDMRGTELPLAHLKLCWLFHDLYDHAYLSWKNILRIRSVYTHIIVYHGNNVSIQKELLDERQQ